MSKRFYGSLANRLFENQNFENIQVGTLATEFLYSDTRAYEVIEVRDPKNITIRKLKATRIDKNGMSEDQEYLFESDENELTRKLTLRNGSWFQVNEYSLKDLEERFAKQHLEKEFPSLQTYISYALAMSGLTTNQVERVREGKTAKKLVKVNISFGSAKEYHDYSF